MDWYTIIKRHYDARRYTNDNVAAFVIGNKITPEQYQQMTNIEYTS